MGRRLSVGALLLSLMLPGAARADEGSASEPVRVEYTAPAGCPEQPVFEAELTQHLGSETFARFGELARTLAVTVEAVPGGFRTSVSLIDRRGLSVERAISAPTCEQAVSAIALIAALAARSQVEQTDREVKPEHEEKQEVQSVAGGAPEPALGRQGVASQELSGPQPPSVKHAPSVQPHVAFTNFGFYAGMGAATGVGPRVAPGLLVFLRATLGGMPERSLVLSAMAYDTFRSSLEPTDSRFRVLKARLELCPVEPRLGRWLASACAGFELGAQSGRSYADGVRVETPHSATRLWAAATFAARAGLSIKAWQILLGPELGVPIRRNQYVLTLPDRPVYRVPNLTVGFSAAAGITWR